MKTKTLIFSLFLLSFSAMLIAQTVEKSGTYPLLKNQIGIQINPFFDNNETFSSMVYGLRYGYKISRPLTLGAEISGSFPAYDRFTTDDLYVFKFGAFARYSILTDRRINGFFEAATFFANQYQPVAETHPAINLDRFGAYAAPGISIFSKNRKVSIDLYYKFYITPRNFYFEPSVFSYKINFNF
jgi:hypothetical protein